MGLYCPLCMTDGVARVLTRFGSRSQIERAVPHLASTDLDTLWTGAMFLTEKAGGSDVGANETVARNGRLTGQKWFCSNVDADAVLATARPEGGSPGIRGIRTYLLLTRGNPGVSIDRLKDKLGTRAMATGEVTLEGAFAEQVGELERGFAQMTPMLNITRLHNAIASSAALRRGLMLARGYAAQRMAFGRPLEQQPLQRQVLLQLALQAESSLLMTMRLAALMGRVEYGVAGEEERLLFRVGTSLTKLYTARQAVAGASEAIEAFGGAGYMEDTGIGRLLRDAQVLPIWEGTTNVLSLDTLRVLAKPGVAEAFLDELARLGSPGREEVADLLDTVGGADPETAQRFGRRVAFAMSEAWIAGLLREAAGRGARESALAELWDSRAEPSLDGDRFDLVVDGVEAVGTAAP